MHVLITTAVFSGHSGSHRVVVDLIGPLRARGHRVTLFWPSAGGTGPVEPGLPPTGLTLTGDPAALTDPPDVIHGQHVSAILPVAARFPSVPVIQAINDVSHPYDEPLRLPSIRHYIAVDALRAQRARDAGVPPDRITILPNAVALDRFPPRPPHDRIARALVVAKYHHGFAALAQAALAGTGVTVTAVGMGANGLQPDFAGLLGRHDLLIGSGRCVLEAASMGLSAIVCDERGLAGALTPGNLTPMREGNFGLAVFDGPVTQERIASAFRRLDPAEAPVIRDILRREAGLDGAIDVLEALYARVIAEGVPAPADGATPAAAAEAALRDHVLRLQGRLFATMVVREIAEGQRNVAIEVALASGRQEIAALTAKNESLRTRQAALADRVQALLASRSWRLTRPLRALGAALRRHRGG
jgi:hypothetical protein